MTTLAESIRDRYGETGADDDTGSGSQGLVFIVSVSPSPQARAGKLPPLLTLTDYNIETMGEMETETSGTGHIREMDLSDNLIMDWSTVNNILTKFPNLRFLNLARNLLSDPLPGNTIVAHNLSRVLTLVQCSFQNFNELFSVGSEWKPSGLDECLQATERLPQAGGAQARQQQPDQPRHGPGPQQCQGAVPFPQSN